jgi:peptidoglycan/xylan/chitin deacetylase (PgdA/CDA1 family)
MADRLLILEYHRVAEDGPASLQPWRLTPAEFVAQIGFLRSLGTRVVNLEDWFGGESQATPSIAITFDDAFQDFADKAWPVLRDAEFTATVFVPTGHVGGRADWDSNHGVPATLMDWPQLQALSKAGVSFAAHGKSHRALTELDDDQLAQELASSKKVLEDRLQQPVRSIAYPYGCEDDRVRNAARAHGFAFGVTVEDGACERSSDLLRLPRYEVSGNQPIEHFQERIERFLRSS